MTSDYNDLTETVVELVDQLLDVYDAKVPVEGNFNDLRVRRSVYFGDPSICLPGHLELAIMNMDAKLDPSYKRLRFLAVRVMKASDGGWASLTCFHGDRNQLRTQLEKQRTGPEYLVDRVLELADGLPEETNPDMWR